MQAPPVVKPPPLSAFAGWQKLQVRNAHLSTVIVVNIVRGFLNEILK